jgi:hypothetical protein
MMSTAYDDITKSFHADLVKSDYSGFGEVEVTPAGRVYFDNSLEDGLLPLIDYAKANDITLDRFVSIAVNLGVQNGLKISHT